MKQEKILSVYWHYQSRQLILIGEDVLQTFKTIPAVVRPYPDERSLNGMQLMCRSNMETCMNFINDSIHKLTEKYGISACTS